MAHFGPPGIPETVLSFEKEKYDERVVQGQCSIATVALKIRMRSRMEVIEMIRCHVLGKQPAGELS